LEHILKEIVLFIGGCRSGKSRSALRMGEKLSGNKKIFLATCVPQDQEMKQRVDRHKKERSDHWMTLEVPVLIPEAITDHTPNMDVMVIDCLTLWINNLFLETDDPEKITEHAHRLTRSLKKSQCTVILVSNEVGTGIVPENRLSRLFRDSAGFVNQAVAETADKVFWMVAGIPVQIKS